MQRPEARKNQQGTGTDGSWSGVRDEVGEVGMDHIRLGLVDQSKEMSRIKSEVERH